jgi:hypothetical protein
LRVERAAVDRDFRAGESLKQRLRQPHEATKGAVADLLGDGHEDAKA